MNSIHSTVLTLRTFVSLFEALTITIFPIYFHQYLGNPLEEKHSTEGDWRDLATTKLPKLKKLDGKNHLSFFTLLLINLCLIVKSGSRGAAHVD